MNLKTQFEVLQTLGQGSAGKVLKVERKSDGGVYALKLYHQKKTLESIRKEFEIIKEITENGCVNFLPCYYELYPSIKYEKVDSIGVLSEYIDGYSLADYIATLGSKNISKEDLKKLMSYMASAVDFLHNKNIVHRDIKSDNFMLSKSGKIVLVDFDLACKSLCAGSVGTPDFMAPEIISKYLINRDENSTLDEWKKADIWSLGITFYELANKKFPLTSPKDDNETALNKIMAAKNRNKKITCKYPGGKASEIIEKTLNYNPEKRLSASQIVVKLPLKKKKGEEKISKEPEELEEQAFL